MKMCPFDLNDPMTFVLHDLKCVIELLFFCCSQVNQTPDSCQETKFKVINLDDGALYRFRVMAVNAAGESDPANVKEPIRVQDRLGRFLFQYYLHLFYEVLCPSNVITSSVNELAVNVSHAIPLHPLRTPRADSGCWNDP